ncbi:ribbon-helix-helix protein, CopG family [Clostridium perfringens]|nr:ribbon-helix-helix protein, CopG family [Clostridium perfringens]
MGRPTDKPKKTQIAIRLDDETLEILDSYCQENGISRAEGTRMAIHKLKN